MVRILYDWISRTLVGGTTSAQEIMDLAALLTESEGTRRAERMVAEMTNFILVLAKLWIMKVGNMRTRMLNQRKAKENNLSDGSKCPLLSVHPSILLCTLTASSEDTMSNVPCLNVGFDAQCHLN